MKTILVVDDEALIRVIVKKVLSKGPYNLIEADSGTSAMTVAEAHAGEIDLLLSDLQLPDTHGQQVYEKLRPANPRMRVLFMSGFGEGDPARENTTLGENFLQKPFSLTELEAAVAKALA